MEGEEDVPMETGAAAHQSCAGHNSGIVDLGTTHGIGWFQSGFSFYYV